MVKRGTVHKFYSKGVDLRRYILKQKHNSMALPDPTVFLRNMRRHLTNNADILTDEIKNVVYDALKRE